MRNSGLVLFSCAGLLFSGGTILGGTVAWSLLRMSYYFWATDLGVEVGTTILLLAGALLCLPLCWLSTLVPYHSKSMTMNATVTLAVLWMQFSVNFALYSKLVLLLIGVVSVALLMLSMGMSSMSALSRAVREPTVLNTSMHRAMAIEGFDPAVRYGISNMQIQLKCCGVQSFADWFQHRRTLPPSCCGREWTGKRDDSCKMPVFIKGCLRPALAELRFYVNTLSILSSALIIVMTVTLFAATYTLVVREVDRCTELLYKSSFAPPLRIACISQSPVEPSRLSGANVMPATGKVV